MFFLFLACIIQIFLSHYAQRQVLLNELKVKLVQAYILTVLLSYQIIVMGSFTLIQKWQI